MELKNNDFMLAIFLQIQVFSWFDYAAVLFAGHKNQLRLANYEDEIPIQRFNVQPILFHLIFCSAFCLNPYINFAT